MTRELTDKERLERIDVALVGVNSKGDLVAIVKRLADSLESGNKADPEIHSRRYTTHDSVNLADADVVPDGSN